MKVIVGDEYGLVKCIDTGKKIIESKYGEIKKKNNVVAINNLYDGDKNILVILFEENLNVIDWKNKNLIFEEKSTVTNHSMIIKYTIDFS
jgi:hypothetical protein